MFGSNFGNSQLEGFHEITLPQPVRYTPQTIGWLIVFIVILVIAVWWGYRRYRYWKANRYRTSALERLAVIERDLRRADTRVQALTELPGLIKQTALQSCPREDVAQLSGDSWLKFLDSTCKGNAFTQGTGRILPKLAYESPTAIEGLTNNEIDDLMILARNWIREHAAQGIVE